MDCENVNRHALKSILRRRTRRTRSKRGTMFETKTRNLTLPDKANSCAVSTSRGRRNLMAIEKLARPAHCCRPKERERETDFCFEQRPKFCTQLVRQTMWSSSQEFHLTSICKKLTIPGLSITSHTPSVAKIRNSSPITLGYHAIKPDMIGSTSER